MYLQFGYLLRAVQVGLARGLPHKGQSRLRRQGSIPSIVHNRQREREGERDAGGGLVIIVVAAAAAVDDVGGGWLCERLELHRENKKCAVVAVDRGGQESNKTIKKLQNPSLCWQRFKKYH